jgi:hypothetical protein
MITEPTATKAPEVRHLKPTFTLGNDDDKSEGLAPVTNPRPATPLCKNLNKEATSTKGSSTMASPLQDEDVGVMHASGGG